MKPAMLKKGDSIAIVSLSSGLIGEEFVEHQRELGIKRLKTMGFNPRFMDNALLGIENLRDNPDLRAEDLKQAFADDSIKAIICAIGGNDTQLISKYLLSDDEFVDNVQNNPKIFIGFSDSTVNHLMFYKLGLNTFYGQSFLTEFCELEPDMLRYSKDKFISLFDQAHQLTISSSPYWFEERTDFSRGQLDNLRDKHVETKGFEVISGFGRCNGRLLGGCVETLCRLLEFENGEQAVYKLFPMPEEWDNKVIFLETAERESKTTPKVYKKMILALKAQGIFNKANGIIIGKPQDELYYDEFKEIIIEELSEFNIPIIYNVNFGHAVPRALLPINVMVSIDSKNKLIVIEEDIF